MVAGISGIGAIVAHDEHMSRGHFFIEREGAGVHAGADVRSFVDGHAVDRDRLAGPLAGHGVTGQADKSFDEVVAAESAAVLLLQPMVRSLKTTTSPRWSLKTLGVSLLVMTRSPGSMVFSMEPDGIT